MVFIFEFILIVEAEDGAMWISTSVELTDIMGNTSNNYTLYTENAVVAMLVVEVLN